MRGARVDPARQAVAGVVQNLVAQRLGRGFFPLALLFLFGAVQMVVVGPFAADYAVLALGSLAAAGGMLLYGNGAVHRALGTDAGAEGWLAAIAGVVPYAFGLWVLGFRGLRPLALLLAGEGEGGTAAVVLSLLFGAASARLLWHLSRLTELHRLARTMTAPSPEESP